MMDVILSLRELYDFYTMLPRQFQFLKPNLPVKVSQFYLFFDNEENNLVAFRQQKKQ